MAGGNRQPPCRNDGGAHAAPHSDAHKRVASVLQGAPRCLPPGLTSLDARVGSVLRDNANREKRSMRWPRWCAGVPQVFLLFLILEKQWHLCALNEPLPPTMAPFNPPPRVTAPSLTACVGSALDTKGGVSRFSAHFTSIQQRRNKSDAPAPRAGRRLGSAIPSPPKTIPTKARPFSGVG